MTYRFTELHHIKPNASAINSAVGPIGRLHCIVKIDGRHNTHPSIIVGVKIAYISLRKHYLLLANSLDVFHELGNLLFKSLLGILLELVEFLLVVGLGSDNSSCNGLSLILFIEGVYAG